MFLVGNSKFRLNFTPSKRPHYRSRLSTATLPGSLPNLSVVMPATFCKLQRLLAAVGVAYKTAWAVSCDREQSPSLWPLLPCRCTAAAQQVARVWGIGASMGHRWHPSVLNCVHCSHLSRQWSSPSWLTLLGESTVVTWCWLLPPSKKGCNFLVFFQINLSQLFN